MAVVASLNGFADRRGNLRGRDGESARGFTRWHLSRVLAVASLRLRRTGLRRCLLSLQDTGPVELDVRVVLLDKPDRIFIERRPSDANARGGAKPVQDAGARLAAAPAGGVGMDDKRVFVAALVAAEPEVRQDYFLF